MSYSVDKSDEQWRAELSAEEFAVLRQAATERPWTGELLDEKRAGLYTCKACGNELFKAGTKFDSGCGWPSFDDQIAKNVEHVLDTDGRRTEIVCANCKGHLGHVFFGERFTEKDTRHCVNSISMKFIKD